LFCLMQFLFCLSFLLGLCNGLQLNATKFANSLQQNSVIMLTAGVSGANEMCLSVRGADVALEPCMNAIAAGDGREIWAFQSGGQLLNVASNKCLGSESLSANNNIEMVDCSVAAKVELRPNGQLKIGSVCLSQSGSAVGQMNIAENAAASASSTAGEEGHSPDAAVDQNEASYWASGLDENGPVEFILDLGSTASVENIIISWEYPAKSFSLALSSDGMRWNQVFETTVNAITSTFVPVGGKLASKLKIVMKEPHSIHGKLDGHWLYGIRNIAVTAANMHAIAEDCSAASRSADARDKYFPTSVSDYNPSHVSALKSEVPSLEAAIASLSATVNELAEIIPQLSACQAKHASFSTKLNSPALSLLNVPDKMQGTVTMSNVDLVGADARSIAEPLLHSAASLVKEVKAALSDAK